MNNFERFKNKNRNRNDAQLSLNNSFLYKGYPSIKINDNDGNIIQAAVVNRQEKEEAFIYTQLNNELKIGSVWHAKTLNLLIDEEIITIKDVGWHKYHCILCNLQIDNNLFGYFKGPEKSHIDLTIRNKVFLTSDQKPLLILNGKPLNFKDKIMIKDRAWIVDEMDSISTNGITYYSLLPATISKEIIELNAGKDIYIEKYIEPQLIIKTPEIKDGNKILINSGSTLTLETEDGYFKSSINELNILKHTQQQIIFTVPFGISTFTIKTKEKGQIVTENYQVVK